MLRLYVQLNGLDMSRGRDVACNVRTGVGDIEKYLVMVEDGTFFYTELNGFDITPFLMHSCYISLRRGSRE